MEFISVLPLKELPDESIQLVKVKGRPVLLSNYGNKISAIGNICIHKAGPLNKGKVNKLEEGWYIQCPWHGWEYNLHDGKAPHGFGDQQSVYEVKIENDQILVSDQPIVKASAAKHKEHPLQDLEKLEYQNNPESLNVLGISTTVTNKDIPRNSTSEEGLIQALEEAEKNHGAKTKLIRLRDLEFRACEGYYSVHEKACTWPCSISEMNPKDGMNEVYRKLILWADVLIVSTPIRWGNPSSLYFKMCERMNCVQNQITLHNKVLIRNKAAAFIITGGQDNVQQVAGQMGTFFTMLGFALPAFYFAGWSRGWLSEDMDENVPAFRNSGYMKRSIIDLVTNTVQLSRQIKSIDSRQMNTPLPRRQDAGYQ